MNDTSLPFEIPSADVASHETPQTKQIKDTLQFAFVAMRLAGWESPTEQPIRREAFDKVLRALAAVLARESGPTS